MLVGHFALYTDNLEAMREFYTTYFDAESSEYYENPNSGFCSYFLRFSDGGAQLEIMRRPDVAGRSESQNLGYAHIAISAGSTAEVDALTERIRAAGYPIKSEPRWTGDGFYESVILDPDQNEIEVTV